MHFNTLQLLQREIRPYRDFPARMPPLEHVLPPLITIRAGATNVEGYRMSRPYTNGYFDGYAFDRDIVYEGEIRDYSEGPSKILRPFFDWVWAKCGLVRPDVESLA